MSAGGDFNLNYSSPGPGAGLQISIMLNCESVNWFVLLIGSTWGLSHIYGRVKLRRVLRGMKKCAICATMRLGMKRCEICATNVRFAMVAE